MVALRVAKVPRCRRVASTSNVMPYASLERSEQGIYSSWHSINTVTCAQAIGETLFKDTYRIHRRRETREGKRAVFQGSRKGHHWSGATRVSTDGRQTNCGCRTGGVDAYWHCYGQYLQSSVPKTCWRCRHKQDAGCGLAWLGRRGQRVVTTPEGFTHNYRNAAGTKSQCRRDIGGVG